MQLTQNPYMRLAEKKMLKGTTKGTSLTSAPRPLKPFIIGCFLSLYTGAAARFAPIKDAQALKNDLKNDYGITKEFSTVVGRLALRCGRLLMVATTKLITTKQINFSPVVSHPSRDAEMATHLKALMKYLT